MDYTLTDHAKKEAQRRLIIPEWIESTMLYPEQVTLGAAA